MLGPWRPCRRVWRGRAGSTGCTAISPKTATGLIAYRSRYRQGRDSVECRRYGRTGGRGRGPGRARALSESEDWPKHSASYSGLGGGPRFAVLVGHKGAHGQRVVIAHRPVPLDGAGQGSGHPPSAWGRGTLWRVLGVPCVSATCVAWPGRGARRLNLCPCHPYSRRRGGEGSWERRDGHPTLCCTPDASAVSADAPAGGAHYAPPQRRYAVQICPCFRVTRPATLHSATPSWFGPRGGPRAYRVEG